MQRIKQPCHDSFSLSSAAPSHFFLYQLVHHFISFKWEFRDPQIQAPASSNNKTVRFYFFSRQNGIPDSILDRPGFSQWWLLPFLFFFRQYLICWNEISFYTDTHTLTHKNAFFLIKCEISRWNKNEFSCDKPICVLAYFPLLLSSSSSSSPSEKQQQWHYHHHLHHHNLRPLF